MIRKWLHFLVPELNLSDSGFEKSIYAQLNRTEGNTLFYNASGVHFQAIRVFSFYMRKY